MDTPDKAESARQRSGGIGGGAPSLDFIGRVFSPFGEKFGVPRQALPCGIAGGVELFPPWGRAECLRGLDGFSHFWIVSQAHLISPADTQRTTNRPPRLGGGTKTGIWGGRSLFRPNRIGLSLVRFSQIEPVGAESVRIHCEGIDLVDGTPVLDIKPYLPYADSVPEAAGGYADSPPSATLHTDWQDDALRSLDGLDIDVDAFRRLVDTVLSQDPRPASTRNKSGRGHGILLHGVNVHFHVEGNRAIVSGLSNGRLAGANEMKDGSSPNFMS